MTTNTLQPDHFSGDGEHESESTIRIVHRLRWGMAGVGGDRAAVVVYRVPNVTGRGPIAYDGLRVAEHRDLRVFEEDVESERFTAVVIECEDRADLGTFCRLASDLGGLVAEDGKGDASEIRDRIDAWVRLFRRRRDLSGDEEVGLWGELRFMYDAVDASSTMRAWHGAGAHQLDFATATLAVEIKTSTGGHRHRTTPRQVGVGDVHPNSRLCSMWIEETPGGTTINELVEAVRVRVDDPGEFDRRLLQTGYNDRHRYDRRFDLVGDPIVIRWSAIPRITDMDSGVLDPSYAFDVESFESTSDGAALDFTADN